MENWAETEKSRIQETLRKSGPGLMFMGFWLLGMVGHNYRSQPPLIIAGSDLTKPQKH